MNCHRSTASTRSNKLIFGNSFSPVESLADHCLQSRYISPHLILFPPVLSLKEKKPNTRLKYPPSQQMTLQTKVESRTTKLKL